MAKLTKKDALLTKISKEMGFKEIPESWKANSPSEIRIEKLEMQLAWYNSFVDAIQKWDYKLYDYACKYADEIEEGCI